MMKSKDAFRLKRPAVEQLGPMEPVASQQPLKRRKPRKQEIFGIIHFWIAKCFLATVMDDIMANRQRALRNWRHLLRGVMSFRVSYSTKWIDSKGFWAADPLELYRDHPEPLPCHACGSRHLSVPEYMSFLAPK